MNCSAEHKMDEETQKPKGHEVGMPLDTMSVDELETRVKPLEGEIARLRQAIGARDASKQAAAAVFKF